MTVDTSNLGKFYIGGQWVAPRSQANMPVSNPANERQIGIVPLGDAADVDAAVAAAVSAFPAYSQTRKSERMALLHSLKKATESRFEDLFSSKYAFIFSMSFEQFFNAESIVSCHFENRRSIMVLHFASVISFNRSILIYIKLLVSMVSMSLEA